MKISISHKIDKNRILRNALVLSGIAVNVLLGFIMNRLRMPLYLDTAGTIYVTLIAGPFFGILTAVVTNALSMMFSPTAMYFSVINALIAIYTSFFSRKHSFRKVKDVFGFILMLAMISGILSVGIRRFIGVDLQGSVVDAAAAEFTYATGFPYLPAALILDVLLNVFDKGISHGIAVLVIRFLPKDISVRIASSIVKQRVMTEEVDNRIFKWAASANGADR